MACFYLAVCCSMSIEPTNYYSTLFIALFLHKRIPCIVFCCVYSTSNGTHMIIFTVPESVRKYTDVLYVGARVELFVVSL